MDLLDNLDASLQDFDLPPSPSLPHQSARSAHRSEAALTEGDLEESEIASGGYSPPAWRRLGNGDRSSGFWRGPDEFMRRGMSMLRESSPEFDDDNEDDGVLERAIRTRLPMGSQSPFKGRSMSPEKSDDPTLQFQLQEMTSPAKEIGLHESPADNCKLIR
jgi:hypothetical protein